MFSFEKYAVARQSYIDGLVESGIPEDLAEFCAKQAEHESIGKLDPVEYTRGFMEEFEKTAGIPGFSFDKASDNDDDKDDKESLWNKIKRYGLYTGIGLGGFLLGNYWPEIRKYSNNQFDRISEAFHTRSDAAKDARKPDLPANGGK